ncbi:AMP-binding protein [Methylobacterium sp. J-077]|uniref:AMP-binding protein n=1 Tax=Methylobacterium sp. J-077 TaxID=2836656 RepID=UPI001FB8FDE1|nr:AMP-binding protein [Methylobacterium sp. J-077]MCJ2121107.1 AMP-binding protein [Methylobacterium sp. J-077]
MLSRRGIATVLQSLLAAELVAARGRGNPDARLPTHLPSVWPEAMGIDGGTGDGLGCDSLERLWLAAAVNEMFNLHEVGDEDCLLTDATFGAWIDRVEAAWRSGVDTITLTTSGTTGRPKRCPHAAASLLMEAEFLGDLFRDRRRVVSLVPAHHAYGLLFTALLPDALGVDRLDAHRLGPGKLARSLTPGDLVVTFPERWRWLERSLPAWPEDVEGVVSTAPCSPDLIAALHDGGLSAMTEVYGSSETAGVAVRRWPDASYRLMPHWRFVEPVSEDAPAIVDRSGRSVALPDGIRLQGGDRFRLADRLDGAVQVGGTNVFPDQVAARLRERPGVREAVARLMRSEEGSRLKAFVVPDAEVDLTELRTALYAWIEAALPVAERPMAITFGPRLPKSITGKATDW